MDRRFDSVAGNVKMMAESGLALPKQALAQVDRLAKQGETPLIFARDRVVLGIIGVADTVRASSAQAIRLFQQHGIHVVMLTGDNERVAKQVAAQVGLTSYPSFPAAAK